MGKKRLDVLVTESYPEISREKAKAEIMAGTVFVNNQKETKAGMMFPDDSAVEIRGRTLKFVSRGGLKLEKALNVFKIDLKDRICLDVGASTGGFTDCMLKFCASKVYSIDVGSGQFDWKLRNDERIVLMEKTNIRHVTAEMIPDVIQFAGVDVSFISLKLVIPPILNLMDKNREMILLIKPQFEAGREKVGKHGVVRDKSVHIDVISNIVAFAAECGLGIRGLTFSPVKGPEGNIEYLLHLNSENDNVSTDRIMSMVKETVNEAHDVL